MLSEGIPGGFTTLYGELSNLEILGTARRGYFVEGLGGAQFALAGAVERLRSLPREEGVFQLLAVTDPAQPYGAQLQWPRPPSREGPDGRGRGGRRPSRVAGAYLLSRDGEPLIYVERGGKGLLRLVELGGEELADALEALVAAVGRGSLPRLTVEKLDGEPVIGSGLEDTLVAAGFSRQPRRFVAAV